MSADHSLVLGSNAVRYHHHHPFAGSSKVDSAGAIRPFTTDVARLDAGQLERRRPFVDAARVAGN